MATAADMSAWIALFLGLAIMAASVAELRAPGGWMKLVEELEASFALRFVAGFVTVMFGALVYLANPWDRGDWLSVLVTVIGGIGVAKGLLILAAPDRIMGLGRRILGNRSTVIAGIDALLGAGLLFAALSRLQTL
ncbi:hypothetical protein LY632_04775 [Erythrobacter sp. SDW2]|uniref:hypothetical protein n=1 Tax=Erythrobacter sp. SDW2 TaxID=2907154 RepID=UPI001F230573|nr:hypothetical protein [Erythrobacter sp. SDW2]UIP07716.1 hypothetical protein LY632_04775 [Erythrobacter sp. SDW2]